MLTADYRMQIWRTRGGSAHASNSCNNVHPTATRGKPVIVRVVDGSPGTPGGVQLVRQPVRQTRNLVIKMIMASRRLRLRD
jgi:hypothetical protein